LFFGFKVRGAGHIPKKGGFILVSNHVSFLDPVCLGLASPRDLNFMARETLFRNPVFGFLISRVNAFPLKRNSADIGALKEGINRVKAGGALLIFPEGTRARNGASESVKSGIGFLVTKYNFPVFPAHIQGTEIALPRGARALRRARISVCFGRQVSIDPERSYEEIAGLIMQSVRELASSRASKNLLKRGCFSKV
jgi:1-acyl-sn-glycerol-3-phosphate acyltransferase